MTRHSDTAARMVAHMPAPCSSCSSSERERIDRALVLGAESMRALAKRYGIDRASLARHRQNHLSPALVKAVAERETAGPRSALEDLRVLRARALRILDAAESDGKASLSLSALRELRGIVELTARVSGELRDGPQVALVLTRTPEWEQFTAGLLSVLDHYPPELGQRVLGELQAATTDPSPSDAGSLGGLGSCAQSSPRGAA